MKALLIGSLSAALGLAAAQSFAQDIAWRPAGTAPAFQRVAGAGSSAVTLTRPVPIASTEATAVVPAGSLDRPTPVFRAKTIDPDDLPQLLPIGPAPVHAQPPGTAKPMGPVETLRTPQPAVSSTTPTAPFVLTSRRRFENLSTSCDPVPLSNEVVSSPGGAAIGDCGTCDTCVTDACWGRLLRRWRDACCCDDPCCLPRPRTWVRGDYLLLNITSQSLPPLLTGENTPIRSADQAGVLPVSPILFGDDGTGVDTRSGGRISAGFWFPRHSSCGLDASFFMLGRRDLHVEAGSDAAGNPVLARPFIQPGFQGGAAGEAAELVAYPGLLAGKVQFDSTTRLWGVDANLRHKLCCGPRYWLDCFVGYRHVQLADTININEDLTNLQFTPVSGDTRRFLLNDHFSTRNLFNGAQVGFEGELKLLRRWFVAGNVKVAMGNVHQVVNIDGSTTFVDSAAGTVTGRGGLYALASNIGRHDKNEFAVVPEFGVKIGFDVNDHWRVYAGYNLLYMSNVVRAGEQIDRTVNFAGMGPEPTNLNPAVVAPARPAVLFRQSDFWAQGGQFGVEYHW